MDQPQLQPDTQTGFSTVKPAGECAYQFAIILAALLIIATAALF